MADVISLATYRSGVRADGTTLCWQSLRHELAGHEVLPFAEALIVTATTGKSTNAAGFRVWADERSVFVAGWDMGPMVLCRGAEARRLAVRLLAAERDRRGAEGPVTAAAREAMMADVRRVLTVRANPDDEAKEATP